MTKILFLCLGNICRSPLAHAYFKHTIEKQGLAHAFEVDSAGTSKWDIGCPPDSRTQRNAASHGLRVTHTSRLITKQDLEYYDLIVGMEQSNLDNLQEMYSLSPAQQAKLRLFRTYDPEGSGPVPDPWYGQAQDFELVFQIVARTVPHLLTALQENRA